MRVSFVITSRDEDPRTLTATIHGIKMTALRYAYEIIIVDDGSHIPIRFNDDAEDIVLIRSEVAVGVSKARRKGCLSASGDVLIILDAHMSFDVEWLDHLLPAIDDNAIYCCACWDYALTAPRFWGADFVWDSERLRGLSFEPIRNPPPTPISDAPMILGACYAFSARTYATLGGFSPLYKIWGYDEQDLSLRARISGLQIRCIRDAKVGHLDIRTQNWALPPENLSFNLHALLATVLEQKTLETILCAIPDPRPQVKRWLNEPEVESWRKMVQARRRYSDAEILPSVLNQGPLIFHPEAALRPEILNFNEARARISAEERQFKALPLTKAISSSSSQWSYLGVAIHLKIEGSLSRDNVSNFLPGSSRPIPETVEPDIVVALLNTHGCMYVLNVNGAQFGQSTVITELLGLLKFAIASTINGLRTDVILLHGVRLELHGMLLHLVGSAADGIHTVAASLLEFADEQKGQTVNAHRAVEDLVAINRDKIRPNATFLRLVSMPTKAATGLLSLTPAEWLMELLQTVIPPTAGSQSLLEPLSRFAEKTASESMLCRFENAGEAAAAIETFITEKCVRD